MDNFARKQGKFLGNSYLMYELQYGVDLSKFIDKMDPLKQVQIINTLSRPDVFRRSKKKKKLKCWANICSAVLERQEGVTGQASAYLCDHEKQSPPVVVDTGASMCLTPVLGDFVTPLTPVHNHLTGINSETPISGTGIVEWEIKDAQGLVMKIRVQAYYVPEASIRLFSPQYYFQEKGKGKLICDKDCVLLDLDEQGYIYKFPYWISTSRVTSTSSPIRK